MPASTSCSHVITRLCAPAICPIRKSRLIAHRFVCMTRHCTRGAVGVAYQDPLMCMTRHCTRGAVGVAYQDPLVCMTRHAPRRDWGVARHAHGIGSAYAHDDAPPSDCPGLKQSFYKPSDRAMISRWISEAPP